MRRKSSVGILLICAVILFLCFVGTASAKTCYVPDAYSTIQAAVDAASAGDTIFVRGGIYSESVNVNKQLTLRGMDTGSGKPVVDASGSGSAITLSANGITLAGFKVTNSDYPAGIMVTSNNNTITGNTATNNYLYGIFLNSSSNNTITGNTATNNLYGIALAFSSNNTITGNNAGNNFDGIILGSSSSNNTITGNNAGNNSKGIALAFSSNNTITGNNVSNNKECGILLASSSNNTITGNNVSNSRWGIYIVYSSNNTITSNTFVNDGLWVYYSYQNIVEDNIVNGKPLVYLEDTSDIWVTDAGQVVLVNCSNITVENLDLSNTTIGIELLKTENSIISNNIVSNNNLYGIYLASSRNNNITGNNVSNNTGCGIYLWDSSNNAITGNNASNNLYSIWLSSSSNNNTITGNNVRDNYYGIYPYSSSNNIIYLNNFINNRYKVYSDLTNIWNSTEKIIYIYNGVTYENYMGNYWSDYNGTDTNNDGIGDTPYPINSDKDNYPLMNYFEIYFTEIKPTPPTPGFEAIFTIVGLLVVAHLLRRRK